MAKYHPWMSWVASPLPSTFCGNTTHDSLLWTEATSIAHDHYCRDFDIGWAGKHKLRNNMSKVFNHPCLIGGPAGKWMCSF